MQLRHYAWVIWHWLWLILLGISICSCATFIISEQAPTVYQASALIEVNGSDVFSAQALAVTYALQISSTDVLQEAAQKLPGVSISRLEAAVSASPVANTQIIEVRSQSSDPQQAADIANAVAQAFIQVQEAKATAQLQDIANQLAQNLVTAKANADTAQAQLVNLEKSNAPADQTAHQRDILTTDQAHYDALLTNYGQIQLQELSATKSLIQIQTALPGQPIGSHALLNTAIATAMALLLMTVLALLLDWIDTTVKTPEDVAQLAMLEPLGSVPISKSPLLFPSPWNLPTADNEAVEQAFAVIGTSYRVLNKSKRAILVTALRPGAGSSTTAFNLAISLAQAGTRVLLVDANLRRPSLHQIFNHPNKRGLVNSLNDVQLLREGNVHAWFSQWATNIPNLWLLPTGPTSFNSTKILSSPRLRILIGWLLRQNHSASGRMIPDLVDIIIFDAPALNDGADTVTLAPVTDGAVVVVQAGKEQSEILNKAGATLQRLGSPVLGVVVNRQSTKHRPYFYTDRYRQNTALVGNSSPKEPEPPLLTGQILSPDTPPSAFQTIGNHQNGQSRQSVTFLNAGGPNAGRPAVPSTPSPKEGTKQFLNRGPGLS